MFAEFLGVLMGDGNGSWGGGKVTWDPCAFSALAAMGVVMCQAIRRLSRRRRVPG